jgi:hypothetical protein
MTNVNRRQWFAFFCLALCVYLLKGMQPGPVAFMTATSVVFLFWYLHSIKLALTNLRTIVWLVFALGLLFLAFRDEFPVFLDEHQTGGWLGGDMTPGQIRKLKTSHKVAVELYMDQPPTHEQRYFKEGVLIGSSDGLTYKLKAEALDPHLMPQARHWADMNLHEAGLEEKAKTVENWWKKDFTYSLEPGAIPGEHPLDHFLFQSKTGFCEHYAAALTSLLRLNGIEARVVVGFYGGVWNPILHRLTYEDADAHAWVEALNPSTHRWKRLDPTLWVNPDLNRHRSDYSGGVGFLVALGGAAALLFGLRPLYRGYRGNRDPLTIFLKKLDMLEGKQGLSLRGNTISERVERLRDSNPESETEMNESLSLYLSTYYGSDPTPEKKPALLASLRKW